MQGYRGIALTDHVGFGSLERIITEVARDCEIARRHWDIIAFPGVELTHVPPAAIGEAARRAKELGAVIVVVHGETITEPVESGTNTAALQSKYVDILAHPGLLTLEQVEMARANGVFLEISARKGHCLTNGHVARLAGVAGAKLILNSDAHDSPDLLTREHASNVLTGAGLEEPRVVEVIESVPAELIGRVSPAAKG